MSANLRVGGSVLSSSSKTIRGQDAEPQVALDTFIGMCVLQ